MMSNDDNKLEKVVQTFLCKTCVYACNKKCNFEKHLSTVKHKNRIKDDEILINDDKKVANDNFECECGKIYKYRQGLYRHKKICNSNEIPITNNSNNDLLLLKDLLIDVVKQQQEQIKELINTLKELIPK